jgi:aminobenzoyl-glutamate utilization protein B
VAYSRCTAGVLALLAIVAADPARAAGAAAAPGTATGKAPASVTAASVRGASALKSEARRWLDEQAPLLSRTNRRIWSFAETSLDEGRSSAELQQLLRQAGFRVEAGVAGMPTAFVASFGSGRPVIGILAEFDALPGVSQAADGAPAPGPNPAAGHACGHSAFGAGSTGAALAIARLIATGALRGTVKLYGTPAEETAIGKVYMLRAGFFKEDDVIFTWHPSGRTEVPFGTTMSIVSAKFRFRGNAAHAALQPFAGRSALDAVELMNVGVNYMREHVRDDARIHYVVTQGGGQPNVVPADAESWYYVRAYDFGDVARYFEWVREIAEGAAKMTQTRLDAVEIQSELHNMIPTPELVRLVHENLEAVGPPRWTEAELRLARATQLNFSDPSRRGPPPEGTPALAPGIEPMPTTPSKGAASSDVGDVSWFVPVANLFVASFGYGLPQHSWPVVAATGSSIGDKALLVAAKTIASSAIELYLDPARLERVRADWRRARGDAPWRTLIPEGQQAPASVR